VPIILSQRPGWSRLTYKAIAAFVAAVALKGLPQATFCTADMIIAITIFTLPQNLVYVWLTQWFFANL